MWILQRYQAMTRVICSLTDALFSSGWRWNFLSYQTAIEIQVQEWGSSAAVVLGHAPSRVCFGCLPYWEAFGSNPGFWSVDFSAVSGRKANERKNASSFLITYFDRLSSTWKQLRATVAEHSLVFMVSTDVHNPPMMKSQLLWKLEATHQRCGCSNSTSSTFPQICQKTFLFFLSNAPCIKHSDKNLTIAILKAVKDLQLHRKRSGAHTTTK